MTLTYAESALLGQAANGGGPSPYSMLWLMLIIGLMFYMLMVRPDQRRRREQTKMQDELKKNDRVVTVGGVVGVVVNAQKGSDRVTLRVDENNNTRIDFLKSSISRVVTEDKPAEKKEDA
jgi:preprotein translocase subunit YajC